MRRWESLLVLSGFEMRFVSSWISWILICTVILASRYHNYAALRSCSKVQGHNTIYICSQAHRSTGCLKFRGSRGGPLGNSASGCSRPWLQTALDVGRLLVCLPPQTRTIWVVYFSQQVATAQDKRDHVNTFKLIVYITSAHILSAKVYLKAMPKGGRAGMHTPLKRGER